MYAQAGDYHNPPVEVWSGALPIDSIAALAVADINGDGRRDILGVSPGVVGLLVWLQDSSGDFYLSVFPAPIGFGATLVTAGDLGFGLCAVSVHPGDGIVVWCPTVTP